MEFVILLLRWLHIFSAITLVGGLFFARFALLPALGDVAEGEREPLAEAVRKRWVKFVMISSGLLVLTGIVNMVIALNRYDFGDMRGTYSMVLVVKLMLALVLFFLVSTLYGRSGNAEKFRQKAGFWLNVSVLLAIVIVCLAGYVRTIPRLPKDPAESTPAQTSHAHWSPGIWT